nr:DUF6543 domain-containing protein [uncultured Pseudomonas sp.]
MTTVSDYQQAVAAQFASRPTLRQLTGQRLMEVVIEHYPLLAEKRPELTSAEALHMMIPKADGSWSSQPFVDYMLQAFLDQRCLDFLPVSGMDYRLSLNVPQRLYVDPSPFQSNEGDVVRVEALSDALNDLLLLLPAYFCQAQVDYWRGICSAGVSRDQWLQQAIKSALLANLPLQGLDAEQQSYIHGLLQGGNQSPCVSVVQIALGQGQARDPKLLPNLLITGESETRNVVLWCSPSGTTKAFDSLAAWASMLRDTLAEQCSFDAFTWHRYELDGDVFAQLSALMLEALLEPVDRAIGTPLASVAELEQTYAALSDPSGAFISGYCVDQPPARKLLPPSFRHANPADSFACQCALFDLALGQAMSNGIGALDGVLDLQAYTRQQLRAQLLADYPDEANYFPDDLELTLTVARGMPGGAGAGVGGGSVQHRYVSLTEFAIGNLSSLQGAVLSAVKHRHGQLIMDWMNPAYVESLVQKVDIGGQYPAYVARCLDDPAQRDRRVQRFGREWRCSLLFSGLAARLDGTLSETALQCVVAYCRGVVDTRQSAQMLMPLAFKREPDASASDLVAGMYVLYSTQPACVLLYRPLYQAAALTEFSSLEAMMAAIAEQGPLQDSILEWLEPQARKVYDRGGFREPHLLRPIFDSSLLPDRVKPAAFDAQFWQHGVDEKLYQANRDLLVELADRQSVSNQESRWAILTQGAWLLFDVVSMLLRGPVATVAWLVQGISSLKNDLAALQGDSAFERSAAVVDLVLNASMALMHLRLPDASIANPPIPSVPVIEPATWRMTDYLLPVEPSQGKVGLPGALGELPTQMDFSWRGAQGINVLSGPLRQALLALRSRQSVEGHHAAESGARQGLYTVDGRDYLTLAGDVYAAQVTAHGVRIVGEAGQPGPWVTFIDRYWRIDHGLGLRGGMPKSRLTAMKEANQRKLESLRAEEAKLAMNNNRLGRIIKDHQDLLAQKESRILELEGRSEPDELTERELEVTKRLHKQINERIVYEYKALVENGIEHDQILGQLHEMRINEPTLLDALREQRSGSRQALIENISVFYNELASMINTEGVDDIAVEVAVYPEGDEEVQQYNRFLATLEHVVQWESDLVAVSKVFDEILEATLNDSSIVYKDTATGKRTSKEEDLTAIIRTRRLSAIDLKFRLLLDLGEVSLNRLAQTDEQTLMQYFDYLGSDALKSAGNAHGDLAGSELTATQRIEVLNGILEAYEEASGMADYLTRFGGAVIRSERLAQYKLTLDDLKTAAEKDMAEAVKETELQQLPKARPSTHAPRGGKRHLVRTSRGRSVLGVEVEVDGVAVVQQRDYRTQGVLKTFRKQGEEWVEQDAPVATDRPAFTAKDPRIARQLAQQLIEQVDSVIALARLYVKSEEPRGLSTVIEGHIEKMQEAQAGLPRITPQDELSDNLAQAVTRLRATQRDLLVGLYLVTSHPTAAGLKYLVAEQEVTVQRAGARKMLSANDYLDVYEIRRRPRQGEKLGVGLWEAHFHYSDATTDMRQFSKGHLKLWSQRKLGRKAQLLAAGSGKDLLAIYRGELRLDQIEGVIPFD